MCGIRRLPLVRRGLGSDKLSLGVGKLELVRLADLLYPRWLSDTAALAAAEHGRTGASPLATISTPASLPERAPRAKAEPPPALTLCPRRLSHEAAGQGRPNSWAGGGYPHVRLTNTASSLTVVTRGYPTPERRSLHPPPQRPLLWTGDRQWPQARPRAGSSVALRQADGPPAVVRGHSRRSKQPGATLPRHSTAPFVPDVGGWALVLVRSPD